MANRWMNQFRLSLEKSVVELWVKATIGAAGAPTLVTDNNSKGIASITRDDTGLYTIVLQDTYYKLLDCYACFEAGLAGPAAPTVSVADQAVDEVSGSGLGGSVTILCQNGGSDTDPGNGEVMNVRITLSNTTAI